MWFLPVLMPGDGERVLRREEERVARPGVMGGTARVEEALFPFDAGASSSSSSSSEPATEDEPLTRGVRGEEMAPLRR